MYIDPQPIVRPINHLSWSPGVQNRLAAAYSFMEFETKPSNVNSSSYIWDIGMRKFVFMLVHNTDILSLEKTPSERTWTFRDVFEMDLHT